MLALTSSDRALGCIALTLVAPAVNFAYSADRLRKDYYHRWVHNPQKIDPETKMPAFERDDRKTTITALCQAQARRY